MSDVLIFQSFDIRDAPQRVNSVVRLACYDGYSIYRGFKVFYISHLPVIIL